MSWRNLTSCAVTLPLPETRRRPTSRKPPPIVPTLLEYLNLDNTKDSEKDTLYDCLHIFSPESLHDTHSVFITLFYDPTIIDVSRAFTVTSARVLSNLEVVRIFGASTQPPFPKGLTADGRLNKEPLEEGDILTTRVCIVRNEVDKSVSLRSDRVAFWVGEGSEVRQKDGAGWEDRLKMFMNVPAEVIAEQREKVSFTLCRVFFERR